MSRPTVLLASADEPLGRQLLELCTPECALSVTTSFSSIAALLLDRPAELLILDVRQFIDGGHGAAQLLDTLRARFPGMRVACLVSAACPEVLARRASETSLVLMRGPHTPVQVKQLIDELLQPAKESLPAPVDVPVPLTRDPGTFGEAVFEGVTRRFETRSPELKKMLEDLMIAASHDVTILLIGETGSGKTFLSNLIHEASPRRQEPFLHVACGALPRELIESELFGHAKGAFTSAHAEKDGKFVAARKGTVLLDEIDVLGPEQQVKLLRVIETGEFEPVGSNTTLRSQARLVVASNLELQPLVEQGRFRPDLYYRLNMLRFVIPPLRRRKVDIIPMAKKFITKFSQKHSIQIHRIEESVLESLLSYPWPGNVRELEHVIQRAVIYCRDGVLTRDQLPSHLLDGHAGPTNDPTVRLGTAVGEPDRSLERQVSVSEKEIIEQALCKNNFSRTKTARDLGISRVTLYNKMKKYEMLR
ncbi:sigma 54-interacting transcriptional regulator [Planctomicrobium sp. SH664]|uniref:sigma-54 interaction domain-containing protein n=1 Tax=Planctomicrobium sp. SH664 TaxID=3448125 RepID=UPI003F5C707F